MRMFLNLIESHYIILHNYHKKLFFKNQVNLSQKFLYFWIFTILIKPTNLIMDTKINKKISYFMVLISS